MMIPDPGRPRWGSCDWQNRQGAHALRRGRQRCWTIARSEHARWPTPWRVVFCEKMKNQVRNGGGSRFRQALCDGKDGARYIATLKGRGYCFVAPISQSSGRVEDVAVAARFPHANLPTRLIGVFGRGRGRRV